MNQGDLADAVAAATGAKRAEAARVVEAVLDAIRDGLRRGEKVGIGGFGGFEAARREARRGGEPRAGEAGAGAPRAEGRVEPRQGGGREGERGGGDKGRC